LQLRAHKHPPFFPHPTPNQGHTRKHLCPTWSCSRKMRCCCSSRPSQWVTRCCWPAASRIGRRASIMLLERGDLKGAERSRWVPAISRPRSTRDLVPDCIASCRGFVLMTNSHLSTIKACAKGDATSCFSRRVDAEVNLPVAGCVSAINCATPAVTSLLLGCEKYREWKGAPGRACARLLRETDTTCMGDFLPFAAFSGVL
jgi:hypothetical protein